MGENAAEPGSTASNLLEQVKANVGPAWQRLAALYAPLVYSWARRAGLQTEDAADGRIVHLAGGQKLQGARITVAGDPSSAAFPLVAALITPRSEVTLTGVMINPLRAGLIDTLREMGADLTLSNARTGSREAEVYPAGEFALVKPTHT